MVVSERLDTKHDFCRAQKAKNTDPCTKYAVKYATDRGRLILCVMGEIPRKISTAVLHCLQK